MKYSYLGKEYTRIPAITHAATMIHQTCFFENASLYI